MDFSSWPAKLHKLSEPSPGVLLIELNNPPQNAYIEAFWIELGRVINTASNDASVRVVVLASALDKVFTVGLDLSSAHAHLSESSADPARNAFRLHSYLTEFQASVTTLSTCRSPVIVATHGLCIGMGVELMSACDIRFAAADTTFSIAEVNVGLAADIGILQRLQKIVGNDSKVRELCLTGRSFDVKEAEQLGMLSAVVPGGRQEVVAEAVRVAKVIAEKSPVATVSTKHLLNHARDHSVEEGLRYTAIWNASMLQAKDTVDAIQAVRTKRKQPVYLPLTAKL